MFNYCRIGIGYLFVVIGVIGLILPILPGWLFFASGAVCLSPESTFFRKFVCKIQKWFPWLRGPLDKYRTWLGKHGQEPPTCPR